MANAPAAFLMGTRSPTPRYVGPSQIQFPFVAVMGSQRSLLASASPFEGENKSDRYAFGVERLHS